MTLEPLREMGTPAPGSRRECRCRVLNGREFGLATCDTIEVYTVFLAILISE